MTEAEILHHVVEMRERWRKQSRAERYRAHTDFDKVPVAKISLMEQVNLMDRFEADLRQLQNCILGREDVEIA